MTTSTNPHPQYAPPRPLTAVQTLMWLVAGIAVMFTLVSGVFAAKLFFEGRLPFGNQPVVPASTAPQPRPAANDDAPVPPVSAAPSPRSSAPAAPATGSFVSGAENILPAEVADLARNNTPLSTASDTPTPPVPATSAAAHPDTPAPPPAPRSSTALPAPPAPAQPSSAPADVAATNPAPGAVEVVTAAVQDWAAAWSRKDVEAYLARYASDFTPAGGLSRDAWSTQRRQRLNRPEAIAVELDALQVQVNGDKAVARFTQHYRAGNQNLREAKTLELALRGKTWLITQERLGR